MGLDPATMMIGSQVIGGLMGSDAASSAADAQSNAANQATQAQLQMYNTGVQLESPFRQFGMGGMNKLAYLMGISPNGYSPEGMTYTGNTVPGYQGIPGVSQPAQQTAPVQLPATQTASSNLPASALNTPNDYTDAATGTPAATMPWQPGYVAPTQTTPQAQAIVPTNGNSPLNTVGATNGGATGAPSPNDPSYGSLLRNFGPQDFQLDPGIQFQLKYGQQALQNSQAAKSGALSGEAIKGLMGFNQDYAGLGYQSAFDRYNANRSFTLGSLMDVAKLGQAAASNTVNSGSSYASGIANTMTGAGNAQAAGIIGSANALSGGLTGAGNAYLLRNLLPSSAGAASGVPANPYVLSGNPMAYAG